MKPRHILLDAPLERKLDKYKSLLDEAGRRRLKRRFEIFASDVFDRRLRTHKLKGNLGMYYAFSISRSDRVVFRILDDETVYLVEIGSHDICY